MPGTHPSCISAEVLARNAAVRDDADELAGLLRRGCDATTVLHIASRSGSSGCVQLLLTTGVDVDQKDCNGITPLSIACAHGRVECVRAAAACRQRGRQPGRW